MFGNFSVKRTDRSFDKVAPNQVIEQTIKKRKVLGELLALVRQMVLSKGGFYPTKLRQPFFQTSNTILD